MKQHSFFVILLLSLFFVFSVTSSFSEGVTFDEFPHLAAGFSYWKAYDFSLNPEHPPLIKLLSAFPLLFTDLELPENWKELNQYGLSEALFQNEHISFYFFIARMPNMLLGVLLGVVVYLFARDLFGKKAGLLALLLYTFSPLMIAHSRYVTTDLGMTLFMTATLHCLWRYFTKKNTRDLYLASLFMGFCVATKYSAAYFAAIVIVLFALYAYKEKKYAQYAYDIAVLGAISACVLVASYGIVHIGSYIDGLLTVFDQSSGRRHFILGENYVDGRWYYFPLAFFFKTPLATLGLLGITLCMYHTKKRKIDNEIILIVPALLYVVFFMRGDINIGVRHIMPVYPLVFIFISRLAETNIKWLKNTVYACSCVLIVSSLMTYPNYVSFFNEVVPDAHAHEYLIDSNLDWGQGLPRLKVWLDKNEISEPLYLSYHGLDNATVRGIQFIKGLCFPQNGYHVASANFVSNLYMEKPHCLSWLQERTPIAQPDPSLLVYFVDDAGSIELESKAFCDPFCQTQCPRAGLTFKSSRYDGGCKCRCIGVQS